MADPAVAAPAEPAAAAVNPLDDISGFFAKKLSENEPEPDVNAPTPEPAATPAGVSAPAAPLPEVRREPEPAAKLPDAGPPEEEPKEDPRMAKVRDLWWSDNDVARDIYRDILRDDARAVYTEERAKEREQIAAAERQQKTHAAASADVESIATRYGVSTKQAEAMLIYAAREVIAPHIEKTGDASIWEVPGNYLIACESLYPAPAASPAADIPPPPRARANPPGSSAAAAPAPRRETQATLTSDADRSLSRLASTVGLNDDSVKRFKHNVAAAKG